MFFLIRIHKTTCSRHFTADALLTLFYHVQRRGDSPVVLPWSCFCHSSISSVASLKYFISLLSRSGTPYVSAWVAAAVSLTYNHRPQTVVNGCFGSCMLFGASSATFSVRTSFLRCVRFCPLEFARSSGTPSSGRRKSPRAAPCNC